MPPPKPPEAAPLLRAMPLAQPRRWGAPKQAPAPIRSSSSSKPARSSSNSPSDSYALPSAAGLGRQCSGTGSSLVSSVATATPLVTDGATSWPFSEIARQAAARAAAVSSG